MVFKKLLASFGAGAPSVDTVLTSPDTRPGASLEGQIQVRGGEQPVDIEHIALGLVTRVEVEGGQGEFSAATEFHRVVVADGFHLDPGQQQAVDFTFPVPWETPITSAFGRHLRGMTVGLRTELAVARAVDKGDLDRVAVHPLPAHEAVLDAFGQLGFRFRGADLEHGRLRGLPQVLPFYQEIEFLAAPQYARACREAELTFVTTPHAVDVVVEVDKRGGHDTFLHFPVPHGDTGTDWAGLIDDWFQSTVMTRRSGFGSHGHGGYHDRDRHGSGMGGAISGAVGGAALGFAGGMLAGEVLGEVFDGGEDEGEE